MAMWAAFQDTLGRSFEGSYGARAIASTFAATTEVDSGRVLNKNASFGSEYGRGRKNLGEKNINLGEKNIFRQSWKAVFSPRF